MVKHYQIVDRQLQESEEPDSPITVFFAPDEAERKHLVSDLHLDEHTLSSALDPNEPSRLEVTPDQTVVIFERPMNYSGKGQLVFNVASAGAFMFKDRTIVVVSEYLPLLDTSQLGRIHSQHDFVLYMIYRAVIHFREHLNAIRTISEELQEEINTAMSNRQLINMFSLQKSLVYYLNAIHWNAAMLDRLKSNAAKVGLEPHDVEVLEDIIIENVQCCREAEMYANILNSLMDARASIVSNNLNVLMKTLSAVAIAIMLATLVVSVFSMNVNIPLQHYPHAFAIILGFAACSVAGLILVWRLRRW